MYLYIYIFTYIYIHGRVPICLTPKAAVEDTRFSPVSDDSETAPSAKLKDCRKIHKTQRQQDCLTRVAHSAQCALDAPSLKLCKTQRQQERHVARNHIFTMDICLCV